MTIYLPLLAVKKESIPRTAISRSIMSAFFKNAECLNFFSWSGERGMKTDVLSNPMIAAMYLLKF